MSGTCPTLVAATQYAVEQAWRVTKGLHGAALQPAGASGESAKTTRRKSITAATSAPAAASSVNARGAGVVMVAVVMNQSQAGSGSRDPARSGSIAGPAYTRRQVI